MIVWAGVVPQVVARRDARCGFPEIRRTRVADDCKVPGNSSKGTTVTLHDSEASRDFRDTRRYLLTGCTMIKNKTKSHVLMSSFVKRNPPA